jgi:hypothetical protein
MPRVGTDEVPTELERMGYSANGSLKTCVAQTKACGIQRRANSAEFSTSWCAVADSQVGEEAAAELRLETISLTAGAILQAVEERDEIASLLIAEADLETSVVEIDDIARRSSGAVMKVRRPRRQPAQNGFLNLPISVHLPVISACPGSVV